MNMLSIVIPMFNEEDNVQPLYECLVVALEKLAEPYEIICIDDGSTDSTQERLFSIAANDEKVKVVSFRRNKGQTSALMAGIDFSAGDIIIPIDGDLQNDPNDIGILLEKLNEGYDVVSGWRQNRQDAEFKRNFPSRVANRLISKISGVHLHDYGCTLKAYRREVLEGFRLYGEMHRFVPIFAEWQGARIAEVSVRHHPRLHGQSKYGLERIFKVLLDLFLVKFLLHFETKPIYVFGLVGFLCIGGAFISGTIAIVLRFGWDVSLIQTPLPLLFVMLFVTGVMCVLLGFLAELLVRIYFEAQAKPTYLIKRTINLEREN